MNGRKGKSYKFLAKNSAVRGLGQCNDPRAGRNPMLRTTEALYV
jgi:hypothetical protein